MAIVLTEQTVNQTDEIGDADFVLAAGQTLKIETTPRGEELLNYTVPAGETRNVHVAVVITNA